MNTPTNSDPRAVARGSSPVSITMVSVAPFVFDTRVQNEAKSLADAGYDITVVFVDDQRYNSSIPRPGDAWDACKREMRGVKLVRVWLRSREWNRVPASMRKIFQAIELSFKMSWHLIRNRANIYHSHDLLPYIYCLIVSTVVRASLVYDAHELEVSQGSNSRLARCIKLIYETVAVRASDLSITVNQEIADTMETRYKRPVLVVENRPCSLRGELAPYNVRAYIGVGCSAKIIMYVGYLNPNRGIFETVRAFRYLPEHYHFCILGTGRVSEFRDSLFSVCIAEGLDTDVVHFLDPVPPQSVVAILSQADVSVMLFKDDANNASLSPNKFFQSMAAGVPVLASNVNRIPSLVHSREFGSVGAVVAQSSPDQIACAIRELVEGNAKERLSGNIRNASDAYQWKSEAAKLVNAYSLIN